MATSRQMAMSSVRLIFPTFYPSDSPNQIIGTPDSSVQCRSYLISNLEMHYAVRSTRRNYALNCMSSFGLDHSAQEPTRELLTGCLMGNVESPLLYLGPADDRHYIG